MTKDEAIYLLRNTAWLAPSGTLESVEEAVKMATEALEHTETHEIRTDTHGVCSDAISRQDTIDAIEHVTWYHQNRNGQMVSGANSDEHQAWYKAEDVYEAIEAVPSAEPTLRERALMLLLNWAVECDFGYDNFPEEYERYKNEIEDMSYFDGMIYIAEKEVERNG